VSKVWFIYVDVADKPVSMEAFETEATARKAYRNLRMEENQRAMLIKGEVEHWKVSWKMSKNV